MAMTHGRGGYVRGCRCDQCKQAESDYQRARRCRQREQVGGPVPSEPGPVESAVTAELDTLPAATDRPGVAQIVLALARILDNPKAVSSQPAAAKVLAALLDKLASASARGRGGGLAVIRTMTERGGA